MNTLADFVRESNKIEGIMREPTTWEVDAHEFFLQIKPDDLDIISLKNFVGVIAPGKPLREKVGMDVRVGNHIPPSGGPHIPEELERILYKVGDWRSPYLVHHEYETLHPFMDGNGRSGRVLWLWQQNRLGNYDRALHLGFLHSWYYASLDNGR